VCLHGCVRLGGQLGPQLGQAFKRLSSIGDCRLAPDLLGQALPRALDVHLIARVAGGGRRRFMPAPWRGPIVDVTSPAGGIRRKIVGIYRVGHGFFLFSSSSRRITGQMAGQ